MKYKFIETPSHGYLQVDEKVVRDAMARGCVITGYSSCDGKFAYLEEDCDAGSFMKFMGISKDEIEFTYVEGFNAHIYPSIKGDD